MILEKETCLYFAINVWKKRKFAEVQFKQADTDTAFGSANGRVESLLCT